VARLVFLAKLTGGPGSLRLLAILVCILIIWVVVWPRRRRAGLAGLGLVTISYLLMATPAVARLVVERLPPATPAEDADIRYIQTLFIFDGDNRWGRLREVQRVNDLAHPRRIVLLGRLSVYKDLRLMPVPRERLSHDSTSWNTATQVSRTKELLTAAPGPAAVLASCLQAPRVRLLLHQAGLNLPVIPSPLDDDLPPHGLGRFAPSLGALATTRDALYELVALKYYSSHPIPLDDKSDPAQNR
jgi:hypothetical protein